MRLSCGIIPGCHGSCGKRRWGSVFACARFIHGNIAMESRKGAAENDLTLVKHSVRQKTIHYMHNLCIYQFYSLSISTGALKFSLYLCLITKWCFSTSRCNVFIPNAIVSHFKSYAFALFNDKVAGLYPEVIYRVQLGLKHWKKLYFEWKKRKDFWLFFSQGVFIDLFKPYILIQY